MDEIYEIGVRSLPIICISGASVGSVLGLQGYASLARFGAEDLLGSGVGLVLIRELGPVVTSLLVTGRAGSAIAAQIGAMVATEQLDGLRMMSVNPDFVRVSKGEDAPFPQDPKHILNTISALAGFDKET